MKISRQTETTQTFELTKEDVEDVFIDSFKKKYNLKNGWTINIHFNVDSYENFNGVTIIVKHVHCHKD